MGRILIADDHDALRRGLARALTEAGHDVEEAANGNARHRAAARGLLRRRAERPQDGRHRRPRRAAHDQERCTRPTSVILMTAFGSVHTAVEAMKNGAFDYVQKPFEIEEMEVKIEKALELRRLRNELDYLRHSAQDIYDFDRIVGASGALQRVLDVVRKVAKSNTTVLDPRRDRHRQGADRRRHPPQLAAGGAQLRQGELRGAAGEPARVASCSATRRAPSPAPTSSASAASSRPTAARCSSTRSAT